MGKKFSYIKCNKQFLRNSNIQSWGMVEILDLRSLEHYKIKYGVLQQNLNKQFSFESGDILCEQFNKFVNTLKKEKIRIR